MASVPIAVFSKKTSSSVCDPNQRHYFIRCQERFNCQLHPINVQLLKNCNICPFYDVTLN